MKIALVKFDFLHSILYFINFRPNNRHFEFLNIQLSVLICAIAMASAADMQGSDTKLKLFHHKVEADETYYPAADYQYKPIHTKEAKHHHSKAKVKDVIKVWHVKAPHYKAPKAHHKETYY